MQITNTTDPKSIPLAVQQLTAGNLVIYPTETCYGIAADATNTQAISRLFSYKGDRHRQVSVAVTDQHMAAKYVALNSMAQNLYQEFLPGPLTVISESLHELDTRLESESGTLGIRIPSHPFALALIAAFGRPLTATSANTSGRKEPYSVQDWQKYTSSEKQKMVTLFIDSGQLVNRPTSTVIDTTLNSPEVLRQGEIMLPANSPTFTSYSPAETIEFASRLTGKYLDLLRQYPLIFALQGELGVGKTQFAKGVASRLGVTDNITSPTYTLLKEYTFHLPKIQGTFYHLDTWRLPDMGELDSTLHISSLLQQGNIILMEWAGKAKNYLEKYKEKYPIILIEIKELDSQTRQISYAFSTPEWS